MGSRLAVAVRAAVVVMAGALSLGQARAQVPPSFGAEAALVTVDVVVLGRDGKPVSGLTRDDFVVKEDGRPQTVKAFEAVEAVVPALESPQTVPSSPSRARVATNVAGPPTRRTFAIVFDDLHVDETNVERAKEAVAAFAEREVRPGDRLVLFTVSDARYWATSRGAQDGAWRAALRAVRSRRPQQEQLGCRVTHYEAMRIEDFNDVYVAAMVQRRLDLLCPEDRLLAEAMATIPGPAPAQSGSPRRLAKITGSYTQARAALRRSLNVVRLVARSLGSTPGRKSLVLVTEGFPTDPSLPGFREAREEAARANVVIHFLDARGLATGFPEFLSAAGSTRVPPGDVAQTIALWRLEDAGAKTLAEETGGLVLQTNDLVSGLMKVADESRVTYLLGYEPTNEKRDGRYRALEVEVRRPGLQVRARAGYFAPKGKEQPAPPRSPVQRAFGNVFDADGIPLRLAAYVMGEAPVQSPMGTNGREVLIAGELRLDALEAQVKGGRRVAEPRLELLTGSRSGESHESEWTLEITLGAAAGSGTPADSKSADGDALWHPFVTRIAMTPGDHRARLVVQSGDRVGSVTVDFIVPPLTEERLSTPILSDRLVADTSERRVLPLARRAFDSTSTLHCWVELEGAALDTATGQPRAQAGFVVRSLDGREWASGPATAMNVDGGKVARLLSVPLAEAPPGEQELILRVKDEVSGATLETREPFRVEVSLGGRAATSAGASDTLSTPSPDVVAGTPGAPPAATQTPAPPPPRAAPQTAPPAPAALDGRNPDIPGRHAGGGPRPRRARRQGPAGERPPRGRAPGVRGRQALQDPFVPAGARRHRREDRRERGAAAGHGYACPRGRAPGTSRCPEPREPGRPALPGAVRRESGERP